MAIDSKLRGRDLVKMKVVAVMASGQIKERTSALQSKTQKPVRFEISEGTRASVEKWMQDELKVCRADKAAVQKLTVKVRFFPRG